MTVNTVKMKLVIRTSILKLYNHESSIYVGLIIFLKLQGRIQGGPGAQTPLTTKNEAPAQKFYKIEAPEWQF